MVNLQKYTIENLQRVASPRGISGVLSYYGEAVNQKYHSRTSHSGFDVMKEDWDNLLILDGCRYDLFKARNYLDGHLESRISPASESTGFIESSFVGRELHGTVYVTSNPHTSDIPEETFHALWNLLETDWDEEYQTVPPGVGAEVIREAAKMFPNKRIIGHFMQPHYPFIGEQGRKIDDGGINPEKGEVHDGTNIWARLRYGLGVTRKEVLRGYAENFDLVLKAVDDLLTDLGGKTVLTADHGNLVGERCWPIPFRGYGHPKKLYVEPLVKVPWFQTSYEGRRKILAEPPQDRERLSKMKRDDRLEALGYR